MEWVRLDVDFFDHPRTGGLALSAQRAYLEGLCWAGKHETGWTIPEAIAKRLASAATVKQLAAAGLWEPVDGGWKIRDAEDYQISSEKLEQVRAARSEAGKRGAEKRWQTNGNGNSKPMANAIANGWQTDGTVTVTKEPDNHTQVVIKETHDDIPSPVDDDDLPGVVRGALALLAGEDLAARETAKGPVADRKAWLAEARARRLERHQATIDVLEPERLEGSPADLATWLDIDPFRPVAGLRVTRTELGWDSPDNVSQALNDDRPFCDSCSSSGMILAYDGTAQRCPMCNSGR